MVQSFHISRTGRRVSLRPFTCKRPASVSQAGRLHVKGPSETLGPVVGALGVFNERIGKPLGKLGTYLAEKNPTNKLGLKSIPKHVSCETFLCDPTYKEKIKQQNSQVMLEAISLVFPIGEAAEPVEAIAPKLGSKLTFSEVDNLAAKSISKANNTGILKKITPNITVVEEDGFAIIRDANQRPAGKGYLYNGELHLTITTKGTTLEGSGREVLNAILIL